MGYEYKIIKSRDSEVFDKECVKFKSEGWSPTGDLFVQLAGHEGAGIPFFLYAQQWVRDIDKKK